MRSILHIYKVGAGPSSSHSMGPRKAAEEFAARIAGKAGRVVVELYGSLSATGKGHLTDKAVIEGLAPVEPEVVWKNEELTGHPNGMIFRLLDESGGEVESWCVYSVGGGSLEDDKGPVGESRMQGFQHDSMSDVIAWCGSYDSNLWEYATHNWNKQIVSTLFEIWEVMLDSIERGLATETESLPGELALPRRAKKMLTRANELVGAVRDLNLLSAYSLAVMEENASGGTIVTAPTCGSSGVLPGLLYYFYKHHHKRPKDIVRGIATAGLFGSCVESRASISGAEVGCQGEVGTACAMAAAAAAQLMGGSIKQIEYAAEMALEHSLGLTCDPILGMVQVPCIERNAFAAMRAYECAAYTLATDGEHLVSFDDVVDVMNRTGRDMQDKYRETARGGLAQIMREKLKPEQG